MRLVVMIVMLAGLPALAGGQVAKKPRAASPAASTATVTFTVTDGKGAPLSGVAVTGHGSVDREATTPSTGAVRLEGLRSGTYRFRFSRDGFITLERDITISAGQRLLDQHVMLSAAEKVAPPPPAPPPPGPSDSSKAGDALPPPGKAMTVSVPAFIEQNFIASSQPQKVSNVACSGMLQSALWQIREPWQNRLHANADAMLYVIGGEGALRMNDRDLPLQAGTFVSVPRGSTYGLTRRGRNPLIVLANLAGEPCTQ